jgi:hypothetical protein
MQTKRQSIIESITNVIVGLITSFLIQLIIYPLLNIPVSLNQNIIITVVFFIVSFLRGYIIRRIFNKKDKVIDEKAMTIYGKIISVKK